MARKNKSKNLTTILAFFFGGFGIHRFYLGQRGNGIIYLLLAFIGIGFILGFIDFISFLIMDTETFDRRYNNAQEERDFNRDSYQRYLRRKDSIRRESKQGGGRPLRRTAATSAQKSNPNNTKLKALIQSGKSHYDNFDFFEAIAHWERALEIAPNHVAIHYNLACAYSLTEQADEGFAHLGLAVKNGFKDFDKMKTQDALAFLRIQPEFDKFSANNFQNKPPQNAPVPPPAIDESSILDKPDLLQQLKELGNLRDRGLLTNEEFLAEKKKLL